ncbi:MAG: RHS repeat-associated core domain-containing protein, partial [Pseudonocardiaceae bacterium]
GRVTLRQQKHLSTKPCTWHYSWNTDDRLIAVATPDKQHWRYSYDPLGRRIAKQHLGDDNATVVEQIDFTWDGTVLAEQTHTDWSPEEPEPPSRRTTTWDWEPGGFRPVSQTERAPLPDAPTELHDIPRDVREASQECVDEQFYAIVTDLVGTPTEMVNTDSNLAWRASTTLWGNHLETATASVGTPLRFPGQYHDPETGLHYNYHRYYDPAMARYESSDPMGLAPGPNPYSYVSNPTEWTDPLGLAGCSPISPTVGELRAQGRRDAHHIIQDAAVRDVPNYQTNAAPGVQLRGPSNVSGTPHYNATQVQRAARTGGTYGAERQIASDALAAAGRTPSEIADDIARADAYFMDELGLTLNSPLRIPGNRRI